MSPLDLLKINVNDHTEKKNGLTYLSWAWAWAEVLKADSKANFKVEMFDGTPLMPVGGSFMVWVTVTIFDKPITCMLPVLDFRNKPIATPNASDVRFSERVRCSPVLQGEARRQGFLWGSLVGEGHAEPEAKLAHHEGGAPQGAACVREAGDDE
jgi:hypothetical protein